MIVSTPRASYEVHRARPPLISVMRIGFGSSLCPYQVRCPGFYWAASFDEAEAARSAALLAILREEQTGVFALRN